MTKTQQQKDFDYKVEILKANVKTHWGFNGDLYRINALFNKIFNDEE